MSNEPPTMPPTRKDTGKGGEKSKVVVGGERQKPEESDAEIFSYEPVRFLRTHSKNNDPADDQTQVRPFSATSLPL